MDSPSSEFSRIREQIEEDIRQAELAMSRSIHTLHVRPQNGEKTDFIEPDDSSLNQFSPYKEVPASNRYNDHESRQALVERLIREHETKKRAQQIAHKQIAKSDAQMERSEMERSRINPYSAQDHWSRPQTDPHDDSKMDWRDSDISPYRQTRAPVLENNSVKSPQRLMVLYNFSLIMGHSMIL